tara:strand:+ start:89 stop:577 length:489 start_codon:yes stop_codon:yes gene_type:complete
MQRELTYNKWVKYIHDYQLNKYKVKYTQKPAEKSGAMLLDELREQEYIMTDNQIIAEFMGYKVIYKPKVVNGENFFEYIDENGKYTYCHSLLKYNDQWDWLMEVVEKIESLRDLDGNAYRFSIDMCNVSIENTDIEILGGDFKFNTTYNAVVKFINEYNKRK